MPVLFVEKGLDKNKYTICQEAKITVGRDARTDLPLGDPKMSRHHFQIFFRDGAYYIEDMGSRNGTVVNGESLSPSAAMVLPIGANVSIGETVFSWLSDLPKSDEDPLLNKEMGGYLIIERLGRGGMGTVYRAIQRSLDRDVAIKVLNPQISARDQKFVTQFIQEARSCAQLNHPNIIQVYDVGEVDGHHYFSMEFAERGCIQDLVQGGKKLTAEQAIAYMIGTARGLEYAEKKQIVHRDIKPENLMLAEDDLVKIGDLGLAKSINSHIAVEGNAPTRVFGTPHYISPEQAQGQDVDHRADMYSFGASFYRILTGETPFSGKNSREIVYRQIHCEPPPMQSLVASIPPMLCSIIDKMMQKNPQHRYASNTQILHDLERVRTALSTGEQITLSKRVEMSEGRRKSIVGRFSAPVYAAFAGLLLTLLIAVALFVVHLSSPPPAPIEQKSVDEAYQAYNDVVQLHQTMGDVAEARQAFVNVAESFPNTIWAEKAREMVNKIDANIAAADDQIAQKFLDAATALQQKRPIDYEDLIKRYTFIKDKYPNSPSARKAKAQLELLAISQRQEQQREQARQALAQLEQRLAVLIAKEQFTQAFQELADIAPTLREYSTLRRKLQQHKQIVEQKLYDYLRKAELEFAQHINDENYQQARETIDLLEKMPMAEVVSQVAKMRQKLAFEQEKTRQAQLSAKYHQKIDAFLHRYDFRGVTKLCYSFTTKEPSRRQRQLLEATAEDMRSLQELVDSVNKALADGTHHHARLVLTPKIREHLPNSPLYQRSEEVTIERWKYNKLMVSIPFRQGSIGSSISLEAFSPQEVYELLLDQQWQTSKEDLYALGIYTYYYKMYDKSWRYYKLAKAHDGSASLREKLEKVEKLATREFNDTLLPHWQNFQTAAGGEKGKARSQLRQAVRNYIKLYRYSTIYLQEGKKFAPFEN